MQNIEFVDVSRCMTRKYQISLTYLLSGCIPDIDDYSFVVKVDCFVEKGGLYCCYVVCVAELKGKTMIIM